MVVLVQKGFPLVPRRLCPVPEKRPPEVLGCWINTTPTKIRALRMNRMLITRLMTLLKGSLKPLLF